MVHHFVIQLHNEKTVYNAGDVISGEVAVETNQREQIRYIQIEFEGNDFFV